MANCTSSALPDLICRSCGRTCPVVALVWRCGCGGLLDVAGGPARLAPTAEQRARNSLWRYDHVPTLWAVRAHDPAATVADGIAVVDPPRGAQVLAAVAETGGRVVTVQDAEIVAARTELAAEGLFVEPTSAVCWAAARREPDLRGVDLVLPLCGAGLKSPAK